MADSDGEQGVSQRRSEHRGNGGETKKGMKSEQFSTKEPQKWDRNLEFDFDIFIKNTWSQVAGKLQNMLSRLNERNFNNFYPLKVNLFLFAMWNLLRYSWKVDLVL